jgi:hypothetical protein
MSKHDERQQLMLENLLEISTGHLMRTDVTELAESGFIVANNNDGPMLLVYVPQRRADGSFDEDEEQELAPYSLRLKIVLEHARKHDCEYVLINGISIVDVDGLTYYGDDE